MQAVVHLPIVTGHSYMAEIDVEVVPNSTAWTEKIE